MTMSMENFDDGDDYADKDDNGDDGYNYDYDGDWMMILTMMLNLLQSAICIHISIFGLNNVQCTEIFWQVVLYL